MMRTLAVLCALTLAACGSASKAGPKTTNPPLAKPDPATQPAPPAEDEDVVVDGFTLKIKKLGFQITMTESPWEGKTDRSSGSIRIVLARPDLGALLLLIPIKADGMTAQSIAEDQQTKAAQQPDLSAVTPVAAESNGRYAFTGDRTEDGKTSRTYLAVLPHPTIAGAFIVAVGQMPADKADAFLKDVRASLDTVAPLK